MVLAELRQKPFQGVAFAVVFRFAILFEDRFGHQGDDFLVTGTDQRGTQQLMMVGDLAVAMVFFQAQGAMDLWGREKLDAIQGQQIMAIQKAKIFQGLAADQSGEDISEAGPELFGGDRIEDFAQASITGYVFHVEDHPQVLFVLLAFDQRTWPIHSSPHPAD